MYPHLKYAVGIFVIVFSIAAVLLGCFHVWGPTGLILSTGVAGLLFMFIEIARLGPMD